MSKGSGGMWVSNTGHTCPREERHAAYSAQVTGWRASTCQGEGGDQKVVEFKHPRAARHHDPDVSPQLSGEGD
jgi:hypothetical protein